MRHEFYVISTLLVITYRNFMELDNLWDSGCDNILPETLKEHLWFMTSHHHFFWLKIVKVLNEVQCMSEGKAKDFVNKEATFGCCVFLYTPLQTLRGAMKGCIWCLCFIRAVVSWGLSVTESWIFFILRFYERCQLFSFISVNLQDQMSLQYKF